MKRFLNSAAAGAIFALTALTTAALALSVLGRDSSNYRNIVQVGLAATSTDLGVTATPTGTQANSYQITAGFTLVTTSTVGPDGIKMPSITNFGSPSNLDASINVIIANNTANSINVFPFLATDVIVSNGVAGAAGAALAITTLKSADCWSATSTGRWYCQVG